MKNDLNLLPREVVARRERDSIPVVNILIVIVVVAILYLVPLQMYFKYALNSEKESKQAEYDELATSETLSAIEEQSMIEKEIERDSTLEALVNKNEMSYKEVFNAIEVSIPVNVGIQAFSMSSDNETISITAVSDNEFGLTDFWHNLRETNVFDSVETEGYFTQEGEKIVESDEEGVTKETVTKGKVVCNITLKYVQKG